MQARVPASTHAICFFVASLCAGPAFATESAALMRKPLSPGLRPGFPRTPAKALRTALEATKAHTLWCGVPSPSKARKGHLVAPAGN